MSKILWAMIGISVTVNKTIPQYRNQWCYVDKCLFVWGQERRLIISLGQRFVTNSTNKATRHRLYIFLFSCVNMIINEGKSEFAFLMRGWRLFHDIKDRVSILWLTSKLLDILGAVLSNSYIYAKLQFMEPLQNID